MDVKFRLASFIVILLALAISLSMMFEQVSLMPIDNVQEPEEDQTPYSERDILLVDSGPLDNRYIYYIWDSMGISYLRCSVLTEYDRGGWTSLPQEEMQYTGQEINSSVQYSKMWEGCMGVDPVNNLSSRIPVVEETTSLNFETNLDVVYIPEYRVFKLNETSDSSYFIYYNQYNFSQELLMSKDVMEADPSYLKIPNGIGRIVELAEFLTSDCESPYEKAKVIESFLRAAYTYDAGYERAPIGEDPVEWFLFDTGEGICTHFNSAFVLMARSIGIPARMCAGYLVNPGLFLQNVFLNQAHAYAEILLEDVGWITFDATGRGWSSEYRPEQMDGTTVYVVVSYHGLVNESQYPTGTGLEGQMVILQEVSTGEMRTALTNETGYYIFLNVPPGDHIVSVLPISDMVVTSQFQDYSFSTDGNDQKIFNFQLALPEDVPGLIDPTIGIAGIDQELYRNCTFNVNLEMTASEERHYSVADVFMYLMRDSKSEIWMCGMDRDHGFHNDAWLFNITCTVPRDTPLGTYQMIVDYPGDVIWNGSEFVFTVMVRDRSMIIYEGPQEVVAGVPHELEFRLLHASNQEPVPQGEVELEINDSIQNMVVDSEGRFSVDIVPEEGNLTIDLLFRGQYLIDGNHSEITLLASNPQISLSDQRLVRGEVNLVAGRAHAGRVPLTAEPVQIDTEFWEAENLTSDENGYFSCSVEVPSTIDLGSQTSTYTLSDIGVEGELQLNVIARTSLDLSIEGNSISARLVDDRGVPIRGQRIGFSAPGFKDDSTTGENGVAIIDLGFVRECNVTVTFSGSEIYTEATSSIPVSELSFPIWYIALFVSVVLVAVLAATTIARRRSSFPVDSKGESRECEELEETNKHMPVSFPDLPDGMPYVWEEGSPLRAIIQDAGGLTVSVDGQPVDGRWKGSDLIITLILEKGKHLLSIGNENGSQELIITAVDYREEVVRLFGEATDNWRMRFLNINKDMTSMEIQSALLHSMGDMYWELESFIRLFEIANYSNHPISRREYESMYLAFRRLV